MLLSERLGKNTDKYGDRDTLHLNGRGIGMLVQFIKHAINSRRFGGLYRPNRRNLNRDSSSSSRSSRRWSGSGTGAGRPVTDGYQPPT